mmetsp:Transcript_10445/g.11977  ORF Transcript_10445/g.11977 Transcript_10445/m.11977 type:complete len:193 (-) Transcript_10445:2062-2640(-)
MFRRMSQRLRILLLSTWLLLTASHPFESITSLLPLELPSQFTASPYFPPRAEYNETLALLSIAYASAASCENTKLVSSWQCKVCKEGAGVNGPVPDLSDISVYSDKKGINQAFVGFDRRNIQIIVSFQGTISLEETLEDLDVIPIEKYCKECRVHAGFFNAYKSLSELIIRDVGQLKRKFQSSRILLTGKWS